VPVVRATGGLCDTVSRFDPKSGQGTGFFFEDYTTKAFYDAVKQAVTTFTDKKSWAKLMINGMSADFCWEKSAKKYEVLYDLAVKRKKLKG